MRHVARGDLEGTITGMDFYEAPTSLERILAQPLEIKVMFVFAVVVFAVRMTRIFRNVRNGTHTSS